MKKILTRTASLLLVLVLMLSVLPVAAFAAEAEEEVAPAAACTHPIYSISYSDRYVNCGSNHRYDLTTVYHCTSCSYAYSTTKSSYESHTYNKVQIGKDQTLNKPLYRYTCTRCGYSYDGL